VPKVFREALVGAGWSVGRSPVHHAVTAADGTTKVHRATEDELSAL
jgi:23S rRNA (adenine2503-C2)-methyltransferase